MIECIKNAGMEVSHWEVFVGKLRAGETVDAEVQKKIGCSQQCLFEKRGSWKDGGIDLKAFEEKISEFRGLNKIPNAKEAVKECGAAKGIDECDTAFQVMKCLRKKLSK